MDDNKPVPRRHLPGRLIYLLILAGAIPLLAWNGFVLQLNAQLALSTSTC